MIIGVSGKIGSGKDLVGIIINYLTLDYLEDNPQYELQDYIEDMNFNEERIGKFEIKKFADSLKDIVCILIGCTREQLEDREFKEKELGEEWWYYKYGESLYDYKTEKTLLIRVMNSEFIEPCTEEDLENCLVKLTPRKLLQLLGTECGRNIIHPNIWVNALMSNYKSIIRFNRYTGFTHCGSPDWLDVCDACNSKISRYVWKGQTSCDSCEEKKTFPNWIITDLRFPNELEAVKERGGITIRGNRIEKGKTYKIQDKTTKDVFEAKADIDYRDYDDVVLRCKNNFIHRLSDYNILYENQHPSETALDNTEFDYVIDNNGTIDDLIQKVKEILIKERIL